jgi:hypothetical protein
MIQAIAFLRGDTPTMQQQLEWGMGKPGIEDLFMAAQADVEAAQGHIKKAREFSHRAVDSAAQSGSRETAAFWQALGALPETDVDDPKEAAKQEDAALDAGSESRHSYPRGSSFRARGRQIGQERSPINSITSFPWVRSCNLTGCPRFEPQLN